MCLHVCVSGQHVSIRAVLQHLVHAGVVGLFSLSLHALVHQRYKKHHNTPHYRRNTSQIKRHVVVSKIVTKKSWERRQDIEKEHLRDETALKTQFISVAWCISKWKRIFNEGKVQALKFSLKRVFFHHMCVDFLILLHDFLNVSLAHQSQTLLSLVVCVCVCVCLCVLVYATLWHKQCTHCLLNALNALKYTHCSQ